MSTLFGRPLLTVGFSVAVLLCASPLMAIDRESEIAPSYDALIARLDGLPSTREADATYDAAAARAEQARALPNPSIAYDRENIYGSGPYSGTGSGEMTLSINQPLELFGQRNARIQAASSEATAAGLRRQQTRWEVAGRLALAYAEAEAAGRRFELATEALSLIEQDAHGVALMVEQGREATLRNVQAQSEIEVARAAVDEIRAYRDGAFARLSAIAMLDRPIEAVGTSLLDRVPRSPDAGVESPLAIQVAEAELDAAGKRVTVEERRARPDVSAAVGMRRFRETGDEAFTVGLQLTIPLFDRNRGGIRAAYAEQRAAEARLIAQKQEARAERLAAEAALTASNSRTRAADSSVKAAEEAYRLARVGFEAGRISQLELRSTRSALIASRHSAVDARIARVLAEIDLARLEGRAPFGDVR